ncbi:MAG: acetolactate synthase large subunit [Betaproteobacteria bacterium]|nr:acetolactate synthase large subunit [Betaproteobacteria bacterium]
MNGAESLVRTLVGGGVNLCFSNPGTSEMHFVAALDKVEGMRCVLGLFEGVVTGAADGYYRMSGNPASTLLHLGPGLANGLANLHNAKKAGSGVINIVGEHATDHIKHDAPLTSDIEGIARPVSHWVKTSASAADVAGDGALAIQAARRAPGQIATLILPADTAWNAAQGMASTAPAVGRVAVSQDAIAQSAHALAHGFASLLLLSGAGLLESSLLWAGRIAAKTGCRIMAAGFNSRIQRGAGRVHADRVPYVVDSALNALKGVQHVVLAGAKSPVSFFAYPNKPSVLVPEGCTGTKLAGVEEDIEAALEALAEELGARNTPPAFVAQPRRPELPTGPVTPEGIGAVLGALLPEHAIVVDESVSVGRGLFPPTAGALPHDWLNNMGGSIGFGLPVAIGAAIACPDRKVVALEGDGSAMYTVQALWTMARENLNVTIIVLANRSYAILKGEFAGVGAGAPGQRATDMMSLDRPNLDWLALAKGHGIEGGRASDLGGFAREFTRALALKGPYLIEILLQ